MWASDPECLQERPGLHKEANTAFSNPKGCWSPGIEAAAPVWASLTKSSTVAKTSLAPSSRSSQRPSASGSECARCSLELCPNHRISVHILLPALRCNVKVSVSHGQKTY